MRVSAELWLRVDQQTSWICMSRDSFRFVSLPLSLRGAEVVESLVPAR